MHPSGSVFDHLFGDRSSPERIGARWALRYLALAAALAAIVCARRPDALLRPEFWAEDGSIFFAQQIAVGFWSALATLVAGFPFLIQRLIAAAAAWLPTVRAPLVYNASAIAITAATMAMFSLPRFRHLVRSDTVRAAVCVASVCIPADQELLATQATLGYFLAIWVVFLSVMQTPRTRPGSALWSMGSAAAVLSAPAATVAVPLWLLRAIHGIRARRGSDVLFAGIQLIAVFSIAVSVRALGEPTRLSAGRPGFEWRLDDLGTTVRAFGWTAAAALDTAVMPRRVFEGLETHGLLFVAAPAVLVTVALGIACWTLPRRSRVAIGLAAYVLASSLAAVLISRDFVIRHMMGALGHSEPLVLTVIGTRHRALAYVALIVIGAAVVDGITRPRLRRAVAIALAAACAFAWVPDFRVAAFPDLQWPKWAARLDAKCAAASPERLVIPSHPRPSFHIVIDGCLAPVR